MKPRGRSFEPLERRDLMAANVWVDSAWALESAGRMLYAVNLTATSSSSIKVNFATAAGTADATDFTPTSGVITFAPGATQQFVTVAVSKDSLVESNETFSLNLSSPSGATLGQSTAVGTILDDDFAATSSGSQVILPTENTGVIKNPGNGYQTFYTSANSDRQLTSSTEYIRVDWSSLETAPGVFNFTVLDQALAQAQAAGQRLAFRIMPFEEGNGGPTGLKGKLPGYSFTFQGTSTWVPDYNNATVQQDLSKFIAALGAKYGNNPAIDSVDIGLVGDWGEMHYWSVTSPPPLPTTATWQWLFDQFRANFKVPLVINELTDNPTAFAYATSHGIGWRVDSWGHWTGASWTEQLNSYPSVVALAGNSWTAAPVIMEPWNTMSSWSSQPWQQSLQWAVDHHVSQFSNKSDTIPSNMTAALQDTLNKIGYRFVLTQASHPSSVASGGNLSLRLDWLNKGNSPMYMDRDLLVKIGTKVIDTGLKYRDFLPGKRTDNVTLSTSGLADGTYSIQIGLGPAGGSPDIALAIQPTGSNWYSVGTVTVGNGTTPPPPPPPSGNSSTIAGRYLFYNNSGSQSPQRYDGHNPAINASDDAAIATDKVAYLPGSGTATFANVSSYTSGINGIMVDLKGTHGSISASDFIFRVGNNNTPSSWSTAPAPAAISIRAGAGVNGSDRVEITWADGAIQKTWLEVIVKGNDALGGNDTRTGLSASDVFFFASAVADSGQGDNGYFLTNSTDESAARNNATSYRSNLSITNPYDFNRDGRVDSTDQVLARNYGNTTSTAPKALNISSGAGTSQVDFGIASALASQAAGAPVADTAKSGTTSTSSASATTNGLVADYLTQVAASGASLPSKAASPDDDGHDDPLTSVLDPDDELIQALFG